MCYRGRTGARSCLKKRDAVNSKPVIFWCKRAIQTINTFSGRRGYSLYTQHERKPAGFISLSMFVDCFLVYGTYWWCSMADELGKEVERASVTLDTDGEWRTSVDFSCGVFFYYLWVQAECRCKLFRFGQKYTKCLPFSLCEDVDLKWQEKTFGVI